MLKFYKPKIGEKIYILPRSGGTMKIEIMFFKVSTGKYYSSCEVDIPLEKIGFPGSKESVQAIVDYQNALQDGWQGRYFISTRELEDKTWWTHLYLADRFVNITKRQICAHCGETADSINPRLCCACEAATVFASHLPRKTPIANRIISDLMKNPGIALKGNENGEE